MGHGAVEALPSHETQRLTPGRAKSQVPRARTSRAREGKVPGTASTCGTGGRTSGIVGMLGHGVDRSRARFHLARVSGARVRAESRETSL